MTRTKSGVIIGFFLRAYRICSDEYLDQELEHIKNSFLRLKYPEAMIVQCRRKAKKIRSSAKSKEKKKKRKVIVVPHSSHVDTIAQFLKPADLTVLSKQGKNIGQIVREKAKHEWQNSLVYEIPCNGCTKPYYGETGRGLNVRLNEHKKDVQYQRQKTIVNHSHKCNSLPDWKNAKCVKGNIDRKTRIALEAAILEVKECMNPKTGRISLSDSASKLILALYNFDF